MAWVGSLDPVDTDDSGIQTKHPHDRDVCGEPVRHAADKYGEPRRATGVSRQTIYDRFGDKDGIMAAAIDSIADRVCPELRTAFAENDDLSGNIDRYYQIAIWPTYEIIRAIPNASDLERGMGSASTAAIRGVAEVKQAILTAKFAENLLHFDLSPEQVARFPEQSSCEAEIVGMAEEDLEQLLLVLKSSELALARAV